MTSKRDHSHTATQQHARADDANRAASDPTSQRKDPVWVDLHSAKHRHEHAGQTYVFCSDHCLHKFWDHPQQYTELPHEVPQGKSEASAGAVYTCPMHPEIEQIGPGDCPICGMALEPKGVPAGDEGPNPELLISAVASW